MKHKPPIYFTIQYEPAGHPEAPFRALFWQRWNRLAKKGEKETELFAQVPRDKQHGDMLSEALAVTFGQRVPTAIWGLLDPITAETWVGGREEVEEIFNRQDWKMREKKLPAKNHRNPKVKYIGAPALMNIAYFHLDKLRQQYFDKWDKEHQAKLDAPPPPPLTREQMNNLDGATLLGGERRLRNSYVRANKKSGSYIRKVRETPRVKPETASERKERYREEAAEVSRHLRAEAQKASLQFPATNRDRRHRYQNQLPLWMPPQPKPISDESLDRLKQKLGERPLLGMPRITMIGDMPHRWEMTEFPVGHYVPAPELKYKGKQLNFHEELGSNRPNIG